MKLWKVDAEEQASKPNTQPLYSVLPLKVSLPLCLPSEPFQGLPGHHAIRMQLVCTCGACRERAREGRANPSGWPLGCGGSQAAPGHSVPGWQTPVCMTHPHAQSAWR